MAIQHLRDAPWCSICEGPCEEDFERGWYVFPERKPDPSPNMIPAPERVIIDERLAYAEGHPMPYELAVELGLVSGPPPAEAEKPKRGKRKSTAKKPSAKKRARKPVEDRMRRKQEDRSKK